MEEETRRLILTDKGYIRRVEEQARRLVLIDKAYTSDIYHGMYQECSGRNKEARTHG